MCHRHIPVRSGARSGALCACGFGRTRTAPQCASTFRRRGALRRAAAWFGSQAFGVASAFNSNIGAWNTARVSDMSMVCPALGRRRATAAHALGRRCGAGRCGRWQMRARIRWRSRATDTAVRCICSTPTLPPYHCRAYISLRYIFIENRPKTDHRAGPCAHFLLASTARGSARRRSRLRRRSAQTSLRGTPCQSPRCPMYAPFGRRRTAANALCQCRSSMRGEGGVMLLCAAALPMHANVCAHTRTGTRLRGRPRGYVQLRVGTMEHMYANI
jgi:hypothetical protein